MLGTLIGHAAANKPARIAARRGLAAGSYCRCRRATVSKAIKMGSKPNRPMAKPLSILPRKIVSTGALHGSLHQIHLKVSDPECRLSIRNGGRRARALMRAMNSANARGFTR